MSQLSRYEAHKQTQAQNNQWQDFVNAYLGERDNARFPDNKCGGVARRAKKAIHTTMFQKNRRRGHVQVNGS